MLKLGELKQGDVVRVDDEGVSRDGVVLDISREDHRVLIDNGVQEFWYSMDQVHQLLLDEEQLLKLGFEKQETGDSVKYLKGPFRLVVQKGDFSNIEMWYREDRRHFSFPIGVHLLQNAYLEMTKVHLERP